MIKKGILLIGALFLFAGTLVIYNVEAKDIEINEDAENYTISKIVNSYKGEEYFTKDYVDEMFKVMNVSDDTKIIADSDGGLFFSVSDNHAISKSYDTETGQVVEELSLDSPRATTIGELKAALYKALEE